LVLAVDWACVMRNTQDDLVDYCERS
jgi:hypothetical protein